MNKRKVVLETKRILICEAHESYAEFYYALMNSKGWLENIGDRSIRTLEDAANYINEKIRPAYAEHGFGFYTMIEKESNIPIGTVGLVKRTNLKHVDIGYGLLPEYMKKGYATEASQCMLDHALNTLKIKPIWAVTTFENVGSHRVLERIGLSKIGTTIWEDGEELFLFSTDATEQLE